MRINAAPNEAAHDDEPGSRAQVSTNADLVGKAGSRNMLDTPCLLVDLSVFEQNVATAANMVKTVGKVFRPHAKSHKCIEIAERQIMAGATGLSVASIGEAEVFAKARISDILVTSTFSTDRQMTRIRELLSGGLNLSLVVDNPQVISRLNQALANTDFTADILIDIDMGRQRSGCANENSAVELAKQVDASPPLCLKGVQAYAGHLSHMKSFEERKRAAEKTAKRAASFRQAISSVTGPGQLHCTGGSTGASPFDLIDPGLSELQWGSYVFMDVEYEQVEFSGSQNTPAFAPSLFVATRVISANARGKYTMDAGDKRFANKYGALPLVANGAPAGSVFKPVSDEHGLLESEGANLVLGDKIELMVPHCDPTVNLFDHIHVVEGDTLVDIWSVAARGTY